MKTVICTCLAAAALILGYLPLKAATTARLEFLTAVYADDKGNGLQLPEGVACGPNGLVVVGDTGNDRLLRFTYRNQAVDKVVAVSIPQLTAPSRVQLSSTGEIYALDSRQRTIVHLGPDGQFKETLALDGVPPPATIVPKSFALDAADNLYVLDEFSGRVLVLNPQGRFQRALQFPAGTGFETDLAVDFEGNVLLFDAIERKIFSAAKGTGPFVQVGGDLSESVATMPTAIMVSKGLIFVAEGSGGIIDTFGRDGKFVAHLLRMGWEEGALRHPAQLCVNDKDEVVIADRDNSRVQLFRLTR